MDKRSIQEQNDVIFVDNSHSKLSASTDEPITESIPSTSSHVVHAWLTDSVVEIAVVFFALLVLVIALYRRRSSQKENISFVSSQLAIDPEILQRRFIEKPSDKNNKKEPVSKSRPVIKTKNVNNNILSPSKIESPENVKEAKSPTLSVYSLESPTELTSVKL